MPEDANPFQSLSADIEMRAPDAPAGSGSVGQYGPLRSVTKLGHAVRVLLALNAVLMIGTGLFDAWVGSQFAADLNPFYSDMEDRQTNAYLAYMGLVVAVVLVYITTAITFLVWTNRAMKNAWTLSTGLKAPALTPGWAVGWYFVPFMNLFKPFQGMNEIWQKTFRTTDTAGRLRWWWGFWLFSNFTSRITSRFPADTLEQLAVSSLIEAVISPLPMIAAILLMGIVGKVSERQEAYYQATLQ